MKDNFVSKNLYKFNRASIMPSKLHKQLSSTLAFLEEEKLCEGSLMQDKEQYQFIDELDAREEG